MTRRIISIGLCLLVCACASTSLFIAYPEQAAKYRNAIATGQFASAVDSINHKKTSQDALLYLQESGRLNQLAGNTQQSLEDFKQAIELYKSFDDRARISASKTASQAGALLSNDNAIAYQGYAYERVMLLLFQALNYLALGKPDSAAVEIRRVAQLQRQLELKYEKDLQADNNQARNQGIDESFKNAPELSAMQAYSDNLRNSILNAYSYYLSAVFWEAQNNRNDALVDYKKAWQIQPNNQQLKNTIEALNQGKSQLNDNEGLLVVVLEQGLVPAKQSFNLSIPNFSLGTYMNIAVPFYSRGDLIAPSPLTIYQNNTALGSTSLLTDVTALAVKALHEQMPALVLRQALRVRSKMEVQQKAQSEDALLGFMTSIYNLISEQADRRSWLTLPSNVQATRIHLTEGLHTLELANGGSRKTIDLNIRKQQITLLRVIQSTNTFILQPFML